MKSVLAAGMVGVVLVLGLVWSKGSSAQGLFAYQDRDAVMRGAALYEDNCAACHGANRQGQPDWKSRDDEGYLPAPPLDGSGHTWHHPDTQLLDLVRRGVEEIAGGGYKSRMQGFDGVLAEPDILAILAYVKSNWPPEIIAAHDEINAR